LQNLLLLALVWISYFRLLPAVLNSRDICG
jgi:hypothetical protein